MEEIIIIRKKGKRCIHEGCWHEWIPRRGSSICPKCHRIQSRKVRP